MSTTATLTLCGTNTGVGKSWVGAALLRALQPLRVAPFKPLESGVEDAPEGLPRDARALLEASGLQLNIDDVCPWPLPLPVAPLMELRRLGMACSGDEILKARDALLRRADTPFCLAEPAGGVLSPVTEELDSCDFASLFYSPVILVARDELGCVSAIRCAYEALCSREIRVHAVVLNAGAPPAQGSAHEPTPDHNAELVSGYVDCPVYHVTDSLPEALVSQARAYFTASGG